MQLVIDAADDVPGVGLAVAGVVGLSATWATERNHSVELLPNIERLLGEAGRTKGDIEAVFVDVGPGGYAALRVGVSIAKGIAHGLGVPIVGIGRLELDAYGAASESGARGRDRRGAPGGTWGGGVGGVCGRRRCGVAGGGGAAHREGGGDAGAARARGLCCGRSRR